MFLFLLLLSSSEAFSMFSYDAPKDIHMDVPFRCLPYDVHYDVLKMFCIDQAFPSGSLFGLTFLIFVHFIEEISICNLFSSFPFRS